MDDLDVLARGYGFRPQGKSNPMRSEAGDRRSASTRSSFTAMYDDDHGGAVGDGGFFNGGPPKYYSYSNSNSSKPSSGMDDFDYGSIFNSSAAPASGGSSNNTKTSGPVYDKPVYDDDIFNGLPGVKSKSVSSASMGRFDDDGFSSMASPPGWGSTGNINTRIDEPDDLLGKLGRSEGETGKSSSTSTGFEFLENLTRKEPVPEVKSSSRSSSSPGFDDILNDLGSSNPTNSKRPGSESSRDPKSSSNVIDDPFVILESTSSPVSSKTGIFADPLEEIGNLGKSGTAKLETASAAGGVFDFLDPLNGFGTSATPFSPDKIRMGKEKSPSRSGSRVSEAQTAGNRENVLRSSIKQSESHLQRKAADESFQDSPLFDKPNVSKNDRKFVPQNASSPPHVSSNMNETNTRQDMSPQSEELAQQDDDVWLTVSEVPLFTQPTSAPPPSRPPPPIPTRTSKLEAGSFPSNARKKSDDFASPPGYSAYSQSPKGVPHASKGGFVSQLDELEDFARGNTHSSVDDEEMNVSSAAVASAAAMKEAMDRAEAKFRHAKEVREREYAKVAKSQETAQVDKDEQSMLDAQEREFRGNQERMEQERRQREEEEREKRRLEKERERERAREIENARARQAVERATREARERAAVEARLKAERAAQAVARERAERAAVQRAQAEARERAAADAKERAEKAATEAREKANAEAREKEARDKEAKDRAAAEARRRAERVATERVAAEARERAAKEARERAANAARADQHRYDNNDLESVFGVARPSSAPRPRTSSPDTNTPNTSSNVFNIRKTSSATNIMDELNTLHRVNVEFQDIPGESEERRKARWDREQRIRKRAEEALAEKNERDRQAQVEQQERDKLAETVDIEIKRWAAGKEGNLRALLSTLQYVLWPECGWQPVSLTDLITAASVKKVYRKATLCIHPDKVQQKGASSHQKYVAAKVFDLLKEAWNKFNSEELF